MWLKAQLPRHVAVLRVVHLGKEPISSQLFISLNNISNILRDLYGKPRRNNRKGGSQCSSRSVRLGNEPYSCTRSSQAVSIPSAWCVLLKKTGIAGQRYGTPPCCWRSRTEASNGPSTAAVVFAATSTCGPTEPWSIYLIYLTHT